MITTCSFRAGALAALIALTACDDAPKFKSTDITGAPYGKVLELVDHTGRARTLVDYRGKVVVLFFGFTHCPDICPATLSQLALARARLAEDFDETSLPDIVLISVDPFRDTPETLTAYVSKFGPGVRGATGDLGELKKLAGAGGIYFAVSPQENGSYSVDHSAAVLVINKNAELHAVFGAPHSVDHFAADLPLLIEST